jgi:hypothetical protein
MRSQRKRSADHLESKRRKDKRKSGVPKLSLWECGIGSVWK